MALSRRYLYEAGLRSFACTRMLCRAIGTAKGPIPAIMSATTGTLLPLLPFVFGLLLPLFVRPLVIVSMRRECCRVYGKVYGTGCVKGVW